MTFSVGDIHTSLIFHSPPALPKPEEEEEKEEGEEEEGGEKEEEEGREGQMRILRRDETLKVKMVAEMWRNRRKKRWQIRWVNGGGGGGNDRPGGGEGSREGGKRRKTCQNGRREGW